MGSGKNKSEAVTVTSMTGYQWYTESPPISLKLRNMNRPRRKKQKHGSCGSQLRTTHYSGRTYLCELPPIQMVAGIELENKYVINL